MVLSGSGSDDGLRVGTERANFHRHVRHLFQHGLDGRVDLMAVGALTHSAKSVDLSMEVIT